MFDDDDDDDDDDGNDEVRGSLKLLESVLRGTRTSDTFRHVQLKFRCSTLHHLSFTDSFYLLL